MLRSAVVPIILGAGLALGVAACGPAHTSHVTGAEKAQGKTDAKNLTKCLPKGALAQLKLAKSLETATGRKGLIIACGIPPQNKEKFEAEALQGAESGHLTTKAGRAQYFEVTLPGVIERNQK
jgi:hypothetical protein